jgi:osmotically-inducible protein OsmY
VRYLNILLLAAALGALQGCFPIIAAGVGAGALMASDRRTNGTFIEDEAIEDKTINKISKTYQNTVHVNVTSYNRHVLLTGEVPTQEIKTAIVEIVNSLPNIAAVNNELLVDVNSSLKSRSSDSIISGNIKLRFIKSNDFKAEHVKVVTERGTVYLLGLVYRKEADAATEIASTTTGVERVVKMFEYLD